VYCSPKFGLVCGEASKQSQWSVKQLRIAWIYGTDRLKEECGGMTLLVLDKAVCGRYEERNCNKYNEALGFNIKHIFSLTILH
jgi:hypothetical protein